MPMDILKQAIAKISASKLQKQREAPWDIVNIHHRLFVIYLHKLPFKCILDFTGKKSWIAFQVQLLLTISAI